MNLLSIERKNAIDLKNFDFDLETRYQMRNYLKIPNDKFVIGNVSRFELEKNHSFLLRIFKELLLMHPESCLILIGDGSLKNRIIDESIKLGIYENIIFVGQQPNIYKYYQLMDTFVLPSTFEGLGMVCVEAEASGLPVICSTAVPKIVDIVNCNYLKLSDSPKIWANAILSSYTHCRKSTMDKMSGTIFDITSEVGKLVKEYYHILGR